MKSITIPIDVPEELKEEGKQYSGIELLKLGLRKVLANLENDLRFMDNVFSELDNLKERENGEFKTLSKIPRNKEDIVDLPIYVYSDDPKLEALKQIIGNPSFISEKLKEKYLFRFLKFFSFDGTVVAKNILVQND